MGFVIQNSCYLHSPFRRPFFPTSSSQCSFQPLFLRNAPTQRRNITAMACLKQENPKDINSCARRVILLMGFAVIPLLKMTAKAIEGLNPESTGLMAQELKQKAKQSVQGSACQNLFFSLLNALGFLGTGVLAALYALTKKEKAASDATIEFMNTELKEKEAAITSLEKKIEMELLNEKEVRNKALAKANEEQRSLVNQLKLATDMITTLGQELQKEKKLVQKLNVQVDDLEVSLREAGDEKTELQEQLKEKLDSIVVLQERLNLLYSEIKDKEYNLQVLKSELADKERELNQLSYVYQQSQDKLTSLNSEIKELKDLLLKNEEELVLKNDTVHKLKAELASLFAEKDESTKRLDAVLKEYNDFKLSTEKKSTSDSKLLGENEEKIHQLEEQLEFSLDEVNKNKVSISDLTWEKNELKGMLNKESNNVKNLEEQLKIMQDTLEKSRDEASDLAKELQQSGNLCLKLEEEVSKVEAELSKTRESLQTNIDEAKQDVEVLTGELKSTKELLSKSNEELQTTAQELAAAVRKCGGLEKELMDANAKAESVALDLKEEKNIVSSLNKELEALEAQISKDKEARKILELDLGETSRSLDEMKRNTLVLSKDLELAYSQISVLEYEKNALYNSIGERNLVSEETQKNLEDAHKLVMRLGKEREILEKRGQKLEEELASAKGEILRLRNQINSSKAQDEEEVDGGEEAGDPTRKAGQRRKASRKQEDS